MNWKNVKLKWTLCKVAWKIGMSFWAIETIFFLFKYGWHYSAFTEDEKICDQIASGIWTISFLIFAFVLVDIVNYLLSERE